MRLVKPYISLYSGVTLGAEWPLFDIIWWNPQGVSLYLADHTSVAAVAMASGPVYYSLPVVRVIYTHIGRDKGVSLDFSYLMSITQCPLFVIKLILNPASGVRRQLPAPFMIYSEAILLSQARVKDNQECD